MLQIEEPHVTKSCDNILNINENTEQLQGSNRQLRGTTAAGIKAGESDLVSLPSNTLTFPAEPENQIIDL